MRRTLLGCVLVTTVWMLSAAGAADPTSRPARPSILERLRPEKLDQFDRDRAALAGRIKSIHVPYRFVRGTFHMHSELSHDSRGQLSEIIAAARATHTKIVGFTEHPSPKVDVVEANAKGWRGGVYFLAGTENNNMLDWPGKDGESDLRFVAHPEEVPRFDRARYVGMEIYNTHADAMDEPAKQLITALVLNLSAVKAHPEAAFASFLDYPAAFLARFDDLTREAPFTGIAANDSHQNQGVKLIAMPDGTVRALDLAGKEIWQTSGAGATALQSSFGQKSLPLEPTVMTTVQFDPYEISMRHVGTFLQINEITRRSVRHALRTGRVIIGFEIVAPLPEVGFWVERQGTPLGTVGDEIPWEPGLRLKYALPLEAEVRVLKDGATFYKGRNDGHTARNIPAGVFRLEAFITLAGERWPWVISNPIYVTAGQSRGGR